MLSCFQYRAVSTARSLDEALADVTELGEYPSLHPHLNGRLVHVNGPISCDQVCVPSHYWTEGSEGNS